jgi:hypothetical protein
MFVRGFVVPVKKDSYNRRQLVYEDTGVMAHPVRVSLLGIDSTVGTG